MKKPFVVRDRSMSSLPSRQLSITDLITQRQSAIKKYNPKRKLNFDMSKEFYDKNKQQQIGKLRKNLESAVSTAVQQRILSSRASQQITFATQMKNHLENKIRKLEQQIIQLKQIIIKAQDANLALDEQVTKLKIIQKQQAEKIKLKNRTINQLQDGLKQLEIDNKKIENLRHVQNRVKVLQIQLRQQKLKVKEVQHNNRQYCKQNQKLKQEILNNKPEKQELKERIAYFERVNLDLQRKMQDYNRRQNQYIKQTNLLKKNLHSMTQQKNSFKAKYQQTSQKLKQKTQQCLQCRKDIQAHLMTIKNLQLKLQNANDKAKDLQNQLKSTIQFYEQQTKQNAFLKKRNTIYMQHELELRKTIDSHLKVAQVVNKEIVNQVSQISNLKQNNKELSQKLQNALRKFEKFDAWFEEGTDKAKTALKESVYAHIRSNSKMELQIREMREQMNNKFLVLGEQRDNLIRKNELLTMPIPTDDTFYESIFREKAQELLLLENSNDQLLKLKKDLEQRQKNLEEEIQKQRNQMHILRLKAAQLFKTKRQLQQARKTAQRYQQMIQQQQQTIRDHQSQLAVLRQKLQRLEDRNFKLDLENKNLQIKTKQLQAVMKELDVSALEQIKTKNQKNMHFLHDALQKLTNGIKSLSFFFSCSFCNSFSNNPITLANCGHNYCEKCKQAYRQQCYECDNGMPIEKVFNNKFLKECTGKYRFLCMVVTELQDKFIKNNQ